MSIPENKEQQRIRRGHSAAQLQVRLFEPKRRMYLHMSGLGVVKDSIWSWRGHRYQANALRRHALKADQDVALLETVC
ncbi:hypothetical protein RA27_22415 [Ruegeria sp. ANG-R]|uniref:hypothetical protein n=1 Tax=Ruegeria sp. ANG-R TaxID=1577903 RepID=UPI00057D7373|nr:hypothetical protein [Ruegeria sp. ANG-R]KIC36097.1 hypothetical protein RA27_22415 [Ruegeria sp. ANG-R]